jgi:hypothetical protein
MLFREKASHGEWCAILLPVALLVSNGSRTPGSEDSTGYGIIALTVAMAVYSFVFGKGPRFESPPAFRDTCICIAMLLSKLIN